MICKIKKEIKGKPVIFQVFFYLQEVFFFFFWHPEPYGVPRPEIESELQPAPQLYDARSLTHCATVGTPCPQILHVGFLNR